ncbi:MAG: hypothetical protein AB7F39_11315 [Variibacter sp.]
MARSALRAGLLLFALIAPGAAYSQPAVVWPDPPAAAVWPAPPGAHAYPPPAPPSARGSRARRVAEPEEESLPEAEALPASSVPRSRRARRATPPPPAPAALDDSVGSTPRAATPVRPKHAAAPFNIRCDGPFAKNTSHAKLVQAFGAKNVSFQEIDSGGGKVKATVLFANDRARRVEIVWRDEAARKDPAQIFITGESNWRARGFKIGETLVSVEKTNGKAFRLAGFGPGDYRGAARDWGDGKLEKLSGGCRLGMRFTLGPQAPNDARGKISSTGDFMSDNPDIRAADPTIAELVIDYPN